MICSYHAICLNGRTISSALLQKVRSDTGVPVVSVVYDGEGDPNTILKVYLGQMLHV